MNEKASIIKIATSARICLWGFVAFILLCVAGLPTLFNIDISPLKNDTWITTGFILLSALSDNLEGSIIITQNQIILFSTLFICLTLALATLVWNIDRLFQQFILGHIFAQKSIKRLSMIGWSLITLCVFNTVGDNLAEHLFLQQNLDFIFKETELLDDPSNFEAFFQFFISLDFSLLLAGLFVVTLARVMQLGEQLQDDVDSTI